jgi:hypothetical protein
MVDQNFRGVLPLPWIGTNRFPYRAQARRGYPEGAEVIE